MRGARGEGKPMRSNDETTKSLDGPAATPAQPGPGADDARRQAEKLRQARFDFAAANQAHLKSMSAMRGKNAGPVKKAPTRR